MASEDLGKRLMPTGAMPRVSSPAELADAMKREQADWREVITKHNIKAD
jgi:tripartite-type tricarboxylate transporter receptor subunit TctC